MKKQPSTYNEKKKSIVFFGSGPVAARSLELLMTHTPVEAIITKPSTAAEMTAVAGGTLPVYVVKNRLELDHLIVDKHFHSTLGIVIDFGVILSGKVIDSFAHGIINSHFSLLPEWRGADPITFSILSGQKTTGVSLMLIVEALDEGDILAQGELNLSSDITTPVLTEKLILLSDGLLKETIPAYLQGLVAAVSQEEAARALRRNTEPSYSRKLQKEDGIINWSKPAIDIEREIRAFAGWPRSTCTLGGVEVVVTKATLIRENLAPGKLQISKKSLIIGCGSNSLQILSVIPAGKKEMDTASFLNGYRNRLTQDA